MRFKSLHVATFTGRIPFTLRSIHMILTMMMRRRMRRRKTIDPSVHMVQIVTERTLLTRNSSNTLLLLHQVCLLICMCVSVSVCLFLLCVCVCPYVYEYLLVQASITHMSTSACVWGWLPCLSYYVAHFRCIIVMV